MSTNKDRDKERFIIALEKTRGNVSKACKAVNISRASYYKWKNDDPAFKERAEEIYEGEIDVAEDQLRAKMDKGDTTAIIFFLKTKGKARGYTEKAPQPKEEKPATVIQTVQDDSKMIAARVKSKKAYIVKLLKGQGKYTAELTYQVDITAKLLVRADMLGDEIMASGHKSVNVEYSREGNERITVDPKEKLYIELLEKGQKALRALGMNTESKDRKTDGDSFESFTAMLGEKPD